MKKFRKLALLKKEGGLAVVNINQLTTFPLPLLYLYAKVIFMYIYEL